VSESDQKALFYNAVPFSSKLVLLTVGG